MSALKPSPREQRRAAVLAALCAGARPMDLRALGEATGFDQTTLADLLNEMVALREAKRFAAPVNARAPRAKRTHFLWIPA